MSEIRYSAELEQFFQEDGGIYWISGWCFSDSGNPVSISVTDENGEEIPSAVKRIRRPDVEAAFPECRVPERSGFELEVPGLENILQKHRYISIWAADGSGRVRICKRTIRDLREAREKNRIIYYLDDIAVRDTVTRLAGWAFGSDGECGISLINSGGENIPAVLRKVKRPDIEQLYRMKNRGLLGFELTVNNADISGTQIGIRFSSGGYSREDTVDLENRTLKRSGLPDLHISYGILNPEKWARAARMLREKGFTGILERLRSKPEPQEIHSPEKDYEEWFAENRVKEDVLAGQKNLQRSFTYRPLISIAVPVFNTRPDFLRELLKSILNQSYDNWELCLADGSTSDEPGEIIGELCAEESRVHYMRLEENLGIAGNTNEAIRMASGEYVMLADHDDLLEADALFEIVSEINRNPAADILYTDEDLTDESGEKFTSPRFKPDFNLDFLRCINYICHIFLVRREIMNQAGGFRPDYDGAQDWDMILRCCEKAEKICHIPKVLYHWRAHEESTAGNQESKSYAVDAGKRALEAHFSRCGLKAELEYTDIFILFRFRLALRTRDKISVIICNRDEAETLRTCVASVLEKSTYDNYEIIIVENNSDEPETFAMYDRLTALSDRIRVVRFEGKFNYSAVNNFGVSHADGEYFILLNNDTEVITPDWMERMLAQCQRDDVAAVGAKLLYPDDTVQHCGAVIGLGGFAGHILTGSQDYESGYFGRLQAVQDISAVTAACMMVSREAWEQTGGLDESFAVALNDMDFCLRLRETGKQIVLDPGVRLYHYESKSRGAEDTPEKRDRFKQEIRRFRSRWKSILEEGDPYYSPSLTLLYNDCRVRKSDETLWDSRIMEEIFREDRAGDAPV